MNKVLLASKDMTWNTPQNIIDLVRQIDPIHLDPCSNVTSIVGARVSWELGRDGDSLARSWACLGLVYVNPPYGREIKPWATKIVLEGVRCTEICALVPSRTDTVWFQS